MSRKDTIRTINKVLSDMRQDDVLFPKVMVEAQQPAAETDPDYAVNNYPRLLQLVRAGLVPDEMISKMTNILKDPRRFGVSPKVRDELYTIMIKTLNYIVVSDPAAWARFRQYLLNTQVESTQMKSDIFFKFKKALHEEAKKLDATGASGKVRRLAEERLMEAARHKPGDSWLATGDKSWGGMNNDGVSLYFSIKNHTDAETRAKDFASGKTSFKDANITNRRDSKKLPGKSIHKGESDEGLQKKISQTPKGKAKEKGLDGPDKPSEAIGTNPNAEKAISTQMFRFSEIILKINNDNIAIKNRNKQRKPGEELEKEKIIPTFELCTISVPGTNLFCDKNLEIPRLSMPQLKTKAKPNPDGSESEAMKLSKEQNGGVYNPDFEVNAEGPFLAHMMSRGIKVTQDKMAATAMKATQNQLDGAKVAGMANTLIRPLENGIKPEDVEEKQARLKTRLVVTRDGYIVDGHHRWGAIALADMMQGKGDDPTMIEIYRIDADIEDVIEISNKWGNDFGLERMAAGASTSDSSKPAETKKEAKEFESANTLAENLLNSIRTFIAEEISRSR